MLQDVRLAGALTTSAEAAPNGECWCNCGCNCNCFCSCQWFQNQIGTWQNEATNYNQSQLWNRASSNYAAGRGP